jgi:CubicO group peptidase (beta-lactamase class C family)
MSGTPVFVGHRSRRVFPAALIALLAIGEGADRAQAPDVPSFERRVEADRNALNVPGLSVIVIQDGKVLSARGFGYADLERRIPATPDTLYHIASVTKTFTAILALQLVEQGKLELDEPVSRYSDDFEDDAVKIKHLLSHTSEGTPGEMFNYNPDRFEYLKAILEKRTGRPLRQLFVETFLDPLAMRDSVPGPDVADDDRAWAVLGKNNLARYGRNLTKLARPYTHWGGGETPYSGYPPRDFWASAGLLSTVRDLAKYDLAVDRHQLLKAETLARAWTPFLSNAGQPLAHGLGWFVTDYRGARLVWHFGHWGTGFSAIYVKVPARRLTLIALGNSEALADHHYKVGEDITNNVFTCAFLDVFVPEVVNRTDAQASPAEIPSTGPAKDCERSSRAALEKWIADRNAKVRMAIPLDSKLAAAYAGRYQLPHRVVTVTEEGGHLYIDVPQGERSELFAEAPAQFFLKIRPWTLTFVKEGSKVAGLDIRDGGEVMSGRRVD